MAVGRNRLWGSLGVRKLVPCEELAKAVFVQSIVLLEVVLRTLGSSQLLSSLVGCIGDGV